MLLRFVSVEGLCSCYFRPFNSPPAPELGGQQGGEDAALLKPF